MSGQQRPILNLLATLNGVQYVLGILRFNKKEFSYFFTYSDKYLESQENLQTGESTRALDRMTCHDGRIHIKRKDTYRVICRVTDLFLFASYLHNNVSCMSHENKFLSQ